MLRQGRRLPRLVGWGAVLALCLLAETSGLASSVGETRLGDRSAHRMAGGEPGKPAYLWLWYADGKAPPVDNQFCSEIPPAYKCNFGSGIDGSRIDDCRQHVQTLLDAWYKDFNLVFTFTRPPSGVFYAIIVTSGWANCQNELPPIETGMDPSMEAGIAPGSACNDNQGQTALAIDCGSNAHDCATLIAHEHGHLVGLEHTASRTDVMYPTILATAAGFDDNSDTVVDDQCSLPNQKQNSYQTMLATLGAWPGGTKPGPFAALPDAGAPDLAATDSGDAPSGGGSVGPLPPPSDVDSGVAIVPGFDAAGLVRPPLPTVDAAIQTSEKHGGCSLGGGTASASATVAVLLLALALLARRAGLRRFAARARRVTSRRP